jgi:predicted HTH domain antitoxin
MPGTVTIPYRDDLLDLLDQTRDEFAQEARMAMAVKLFEMKRISSGIAAELAGVDRATFLLGLHRFRVPMIDLASDDLASDVENA